MISVNTWLAGFFACATLQYAIYWSRSRQERALLVFSIQCAAYTGFYLAIAAYFGATTIAECQAALDRFVTFGVLIHAVYLQLYAYLGARRDYVFRALCTGVLLFLVGLHQWAPLRGTVIELQTVQLLGGGTSLVPIRTPASGALAILYVAVLLNNLYGFFVARLLWKRDRTGAALVAGASAAVLVGAGLGFLIDFAGVRAPYIGAWTHALFVGFMTFFLSREYANRRLLVATTEAAKEDAERAYQAKSQFLAHISHEIRTPLHVMLGHAQALDRASLGETQRGKLGTLIASGRHLQTLIDALLEMSKIEVGRPELVESPFDPGATLLEVQRMFAIEATTRGVELTLERTSALPARLLGDGAKTKQILINLVGNAIKFTARGAVRMTASARALADGSQRVEISVSDTGIGIAPDDAARIFRAFEQLDAGKRAGGTGLGLAISLAHARLMGGDIVVASTPGSGSTFTFSYVGKPAAPPEPVSAEPVTSVQASATGRKVLIVDDVALNRDLLSEFLSGNGFETRTATDGAEALSIHADWQPDVVLIDLRMHGMGGVEAIRRMRDARSRATIGALSASVLEEDERLARAAGASFFMRKPYDYDELLGEIARALGAAPAVSRTPAPPSEPSNIAVLH